MFSCAPCGCTSYFRSDFTVSFKRKLRELASWRNNQKILQSAGLNTAAPVLRHTLSTLLSAPWVPDPSLSPELAPPSLLSAASVRGLKAFAASSPGWAPPDFTQVKPATALLGVCIVPHGPLASYPGAPLSMLSCGHCGTPLSTHTHTT